MVPEMADRNGADEQPHEAGEWAGGHVARGERGDTDSERRRKRALFLRELNEAKELRERVQPRRARVARLRQQMRMRTFRW